MTKRELERQVQLIGKDIYSFCIYLTKRVQTAEELYQDTWLEACKNAEKIDETINVKSYLMGISLRLWKSRKRKYARRNSIAIEVELLPETFASDYSPDALENILQDEEKECVQRAVGHLDDKYRIPILLFYMEELPVAEIAQVMKIPRGTVLSRLSHARKLLKKELEAYLDER